MKFFTEANLSEKPTLDWLKELGYEVVFGPDIAPGGSLQERENYRDVVLRPRLFRALKRLNPKLPSVAFEEVLRTFKHLSEQRDLVMANKAIYELLVRGVTVKFRGEGNKQITEIVRLFDFAEAKNNEFLAVNQFAVQGVSQEGVDIIRRPDIVIFVNGIPLGVFEVKSAFSTSKKATSKAAIKQLDRYKKEIPGLFAYNQVLVVGDLNRAWHGTITSTPEWFAEWKYIEDEGEKNDPNLGTLVKGIFERGRFMDIFQNFMVFEADSDDNATMFSKKMCKYHQYYGVKRAVVSTVKAMGVKGNRKVGVFWHTQGSGKTLSMVFYVNKLRALTELKSPMVLFLTDRTDLDGQIYKTFKRTGYGALAKHMPTIQKLRDKLKNPGAEIVFTTVQKFTEGTDVLSENSNIIVVADEAHRSQYKNLAGNMRVALPNASYLGITGTPIAFSDRDTEVVFGKKISTYAIDQAVKDEATVPLYYEAQLIPLDLNNYEIDEKVGEYFVDEISVEEQNNIQRKFVKLEGPVSAPERLDRIAKHIVEHFNNRGLVGKAMVVTITRRVAVELYKRICAISDSPEAAVVISNPEEFRSEIQKEIDSKELEKQFKNPNNPLKLAIVCDMWLTGFDAPVVHTMYIDKPIKGHTLMQAIARANRVYKDKPAGLIVDYIGVASELKRALSLYSKDVKDKGAFPLEEAIGLMMKKYNATLRFVDGVSIERWRKLSGVKLAELFQAALASILGEMSRIDDERKNNFIKESLGLEKIHALIMPHASANEIRDDVYFFGALRQAIYKYTVVANTASEITEEAETAIKQLIAESFKAGDVIDLFGNQGKNRPEISIFDEKFLQEVKKLKFKNLAAETLRKLLDDELRLRERKNRSRYEHLSVLLKELIEKYENNIISSSEVIEGLLRLAKEIKLQDEVGLNLGLSEEELAFYDALWEGKDAMKADEKLKEMVKEIVKMIRRDITVDWTDNEVVRSRIRANVRLLLLKNGFSSKEAPVIIERIFIQARVLYEDRVLVKEIKYA